MTTMDKTQPGHVSGKSANILAGVFYGGVALTALAGQITAADKLGLPMLIAVPGMALLELGGVALAARADFRRRLGEQANAARLLSAGVALFAVVFNWIGHQDNLFAAGVFAFMSALGYLVWLINSGDRRRDQLRAEGKLTATPPVYGLPQWVRHPWLTRRARALASADPSLGVHGSLRAAEQAIRLERRQAAISKALRGKLASSVDPTTAQIAVHTFDLDQIAARLASEADYDGLTALLAAEMTPVLLTATAKARTTKANARKAIGDDTATTSKATAGNGTRRQSTADRVAKTVAKMPTASTAQIAAKLGVSERTVQRHMPKPDHMPTDVVAGLATATA